MSYLERDFREKEPIHDHCGIIAAYCSEDTDFFVPGVAGLQKLQTRGIDGAGVVAINADGKVNVLKGQGMINEVFDENAFDGFAHLRAATWLLQTRYGTQGLSTMENVQPIIKTLKSTGEAFTIVHNGQFAYESMTDSPDSDSVIFAELLANSDCGSWDEAIMEMQMTSSGAWSLAIATPEGLYLLRDPHGIRPLSYGQKYDSLGNIVWVAASETEGLRSMGVHNYQEVMPGSVIKINNSGVHFLQENLNSRKDLAACIFENVYLGNGNSTILAPRVTSSEIRNAISIAQFRKHCGELLALQESTGFADNVDFAVGIPGTGIAGGRSYAEALGIPYIQAIIDRKPQEHDPRTFMTPDISKIREKIAKHFYFEKNFLKGMRVVLIDDSIVRGNITAGLSELLKGEFGVKEVHFRVLCPPIDKPCYLGVNTRKTIELIASRHNGDIEKIRKEIGADSLGYLTDSALYEAAGQNSGFCLGCMVGHHPPIDRCGKKNERN